MDPRPLNQVLAITLNRVIETSGISESALAGQAKVAANTISNYRAWSPDDFTPKGKAKSAKLVEVERIAAALGVHPLMMLIDMEDKPAVLDLVARLTAHLAAPESAPLTQAPGNVPLKQQRRANGV